MTKTKSKGDEDYEENREKVESVLFDFIILLYVYGDGRKQTVEGCQ